MSTLIIAIIILAFAVPGGLIINILFGGTNSARPTVADISARIEREDAR